MIHDLSSVNLRDFKCVRLEYGLYTIWYRQIKKSYWFQSKRHQTQSDGKTRWMFGRNISVVTLFLMSILGENALIKLAENIAFSIWNGFLTVGYFIAKIQTIFIMIKFTKINLDVTIHKYRLHAIIRINTCSMNKYQVHSWRFQLQHSKRKKHFLQKFAFKGEKCYIL